MILVVSPNLAVDQTVHVDHLVAGHVHRSKSTRREPGGKGVNVARVLTTLESSLRAHGFRRRITGAVHHPGIEGREDLIQTLSNPETKVAPVICWWMMSVCSRPSSTNPVPKSAQKKLSHWSPCFDSSSPCANGWSFREVCRQAAPAGLYAELMALAQAAGKRTLLDCSGVALRPAAEARPFMLKINHAEAASLIDVPIANVEQAVQAAEVLQSKFAALVMITLGASGAVLASDDDRYLFVPPAIQVRNTVGSGDATLAGLVAGLIQGLPIEELGKLATAAGAANALHGGGHCTRAEIEELRPRVQCRPMNC